MNKTVLATGRVMAETPLLSLLSLGSALTLCYPPPSTFSLHWTWLLNTITQLLLAVLTLPLSLNME